jgi:hypothetical protein
MRNLVAVTTLLAICLTLSCAKKPTPEECQQAVGNLSKLLSKHVIEQMRKNIVDTGPVGAAAREDMDKALKRVEESSGLEDADQRNFEICAKQKQTRVICVSAAKTLDETVQTCGMKQLEGGPGDVTISWPD